VDLLNRSAQEYQKPKYIRFDPIAIPHGFDDPLDIEIIGLFAALLAWGQRKTTLSKLEDLCTRMHYSPANFVNTFDDNKAKMLGGFKHRTFNSDDAVWICRNLSSLYTYHGSIESLFRSSISEDDTNIGAGIEALSKFLSQQPQTPLRLSKHLARPSKNSACKRLCMFARWMVRRGSFDLGVWEGIRTDQLVIPLDVHTGRQARKLGLLRRKTNDWQAALELTTICKQIDPVDPVRFDFALFGIGAYAEKDT